MGKKAAGPLTPPLKWAGGKRWLVPVLRDLYLTAAAFPLDHREGAPGEHRHRRLVEPFVGGLAVSLGLLPEHALLADTNPHPVNFYRWLQRGLVIDIPMENSESCFYESRRRFNEIVAAGSSDSKEAACLFYYLNRTCYNGLCRFNRSGGFNVPFGDYKTINYRRDFSDYALVLGPWELQCADFEQIRTGQDDFVYADPPYDVQFRQYSSGGFTWDDQVRLAEWLSRRPGPVVASNQATDRILELY
ncbi:MAG TPA: Dam family site-specific DNA-(adenine-N6)-methyltransferase, partial [Armatimonadota bacterium]|nr:Dam family site-specific DNA-(adenine-N6)-methyltransferase [Armatimonadota bacterium]